MHGTLKLLWIGTPLSVALQKTNFRRLLRTVEALSDLGPAITGDREFSQTARSMLAALMQAGGAREAVLFRFGDKPSLLTSLSSDGFVLMPDPAVIPLLPKHIHALVTTPSSVVLSDGIVENFLSTNGNVAPELFHCLTPLKTAGKLVGVVAFGRREDDGPYDGEELEALDLLCNYVALALQNYNLTQTLAQRVGDNLRMLGSLHGFYDNALEAFASAIDVKHVNIHGHSRRVARYAAGIGEALGLDAEEISSLRSAGLLHDIGKVSVDKRLFAKSTSLDADEFREMADHTVIGHQIVSGVHFPWPRMADIVRWHHERADGSGYPDGLVMDEVPLPARIIGLADTFDAMTSERPYRDSISLGGTLSEIVRMTPSKFDPTVVQALLIQVRRDAIGSNHTPFLEERMAGNLAATDVDHLASNLQHKMTHGRLFLT